VSGEQVTVLLRTAAGDEVRRAEPCTSLVQVCRSALVPPGAVSTFAVNGAGAVRRIVGMDLRLDELVRDGEHVVLQFDRNINYLPLLDAAHVRDATTTPDPVTEYAFAANTYGHVTHVPLSVAACREFVQEAVDDFVSEHQHLFERTSVVVGTSGGGDSNALLTALSTATRHLSTQVRPVMLLGIPEWDAAAPRARELCGDLGLTLTHIGAARINALLGRPPTHPDWLGDFRRHFPADDIDVIGTLAIRLALADAARAGGSRCVVTGLNLEDVLAECFLRVAQGRLPLPFPVRDLDGTAFCYPVHRVPKKILDGCHPTYALANYRQRSIGVMMGRAIPYFLAQSMNATIPGIEFDLLEGFRTLPHEQPVAESGLGFATVPGAGQEATDRWMSYTTGDAPRAG
jgi:hypothetical protein